MNRMLIVVVAIESFVVASVLFSTETDGFQIERRSAAAERNPDNYPDYQLGVKYDEYPVSVLLYVVANIAWNILKFMLKDEFEEN